MPRGGRRPGAGRKPKSASARVLTHPSSLPPAPAAPEIPLVPVEPPPTLTGDPLQIWRDQAPHALAARTLTPASAQAFARYCRLVAQEQHEAQSSAVNGANHRGLVRQINALELQFLLAPNGRPMGGAAPALERPAGPLAKLTRFLT
jgi:hypothetical protein